MKIAKWNIFIFRKHTLADIFVASVSKYLVRSFLFLVHVLLEKKYERKVYLYRLNIFYDNNSEKILNWLAQEKETLPFNIKDSKGIVIISPGHYTTSHFLTKVNEIIFNDTATAIKHKASNNFIQNFMFFHKKII